MKKLLVLALLLLAVAGQAAALDFTIQDSCQNGETALFSISNTTNAHAAGPDFYQGYSGTYGREGKQVCASPDVEDVEIAEGCQQYISNPVLSFRDPDSGSTHLATDEDAYDYTLCSSNLATSVRQSCPGRSTPIVSIYGPVENHVAEPGHYDWQVCGALFDNATLAYEFTMDGNTTFITNGGFGTYNVTEETSERPAYAAVQTDILMSGLVGNNLMNQTIESIRYGDRARFSVTEPGRGQGQWFLPYTTGTSNDIESRFDLIMDREFMEQFNPNFAFELAENILVTISLSFEDVDLVDSLRLGPGLYQLNIENEGDNTDGEPKVSINATTQ